MKKSNLLISEPPLQVSPSLADAIGLNEAIVLQQLHYWLNNKNCQGEVDNDGNKWIFNSYAEWKETNFPFWSVQTIQRIFLHLEELGIVISSQPHAHSRDMRKFYRIDYDHLDTMDSINLTPSIISNRDDVNKNTETTTDINTHTHTRPNFQTLTIAQAYKLPTLRTYRDATGFFPGQGAWECVHDTIAANNLTIEQIRPVYNDWVARGFKPENVKGILDVVVNGWKVAERKTHAADKPVTKTNRRNYNLPPSAADLEAGRRARELIRETERQLSQV